MLWHKLDYMVHLGLRPWWTARCAAPPLCGAPRLDARPLTGCRNCTLVHDTAPVTLEAWLRDDSAASTGAADDEAHGVLWPMVDAGATSSDGSREGLRCPTGANHGCCMLPTDCASGQVCLIVPLPCWTLTLHYVSCMPFIPCFRPRLRRVLCSGPGEKEVSTVRR